MYSSPKLLRYGKFRDLTLEVPCPNDPQIPWQGKIYPTVDIAIGAGADASDGCPARS